MQIVPLNVTFGLFFSHNFKLQPSADYLVRLWPAFIVSCGKHSRSSNADNEVNNDPQS